MAVCPSRLIQMWEHHFACGSQDLKEEFMPLSPEALDEEDKFNEYLDAAWLSFRKQLLEVGIRDRAVGAKTTGEPAFTVCSDAIGTSWAKVFLVERNIEQSHVAGMHSERWNIP